MSLETATTIWTIRAALICMAITFAIRLWQVGRSGSMKRDASIEEADGSLAPNLAMEIAKSVWLIGSLFSLIHAIAAMGFYHQFNHQLAVEDTAQQTESLLGVRVGIGIWFNYAFVSTWLVDALWWIATPKGYERRSSWINKLVCGFLVFIAINGAIVFESGIVRWVSIGVIACLVGLYFVRKGQLNSA